MNSRDLLAFGFGNLWRRKTKTILTILGVVIGTTAIVIMISLGIGMNENFKRELENMGSLNIIDVNMPYRGPGMYERGGPMKNVKLDDKALAEFRKLQGVDAVTPIVQEYMRFAVGKYVTDVSVIGMDTSVMEKFDFKIEKGRNLRPGDTTAVVFGCNLPTMFYNSKSRNFYGMGSANPVNVVTDKLLLTMNHQYGERRQSSSGSDENSKPLKVYKVKGVGVLLQSNDEKDYNAYMDIKQLGKIISEGRKSQRQQGMGDYSSGQGYQQAKIKVKDIQDVQRIQQQIKDMGYECFSLSDILKSMQETALGIQALLGGIGAISLLVAALGITNTMIMSIYERTREIGVMKVLGANLSDIRKLFLFEAGMIGFLGGLLGIAFSYAISYLLNYAGLSFINFMGPTGDGSKLSVIPLWLSAAAVAFAAIVGLISGFYPARRAMRLSALEAIKTE